jgi:adenylate cyclase
MPGSEIQAQLLENLFDQTLLRRPHWAQAFETAAFIVLGMLLVWATPRWKPRNAAALIAVIAVVAIAAAYAAFRWQRLLFDAATPLLSMMVLFSVLLVLTLGEAARQRRALERVVAVQREEAAYIAGELRAAQRIQTGILPASDLFVADRRIDLAALMVPAREVGGDLYDFFLLDDRRLFFLIGDVAGKGLSASMFMAVSKALYKSAALKARDTSVGTLMSTANIEVSRDNSEMFFVTALAGVLDLETGDLIYCNAGHENPYVVGGEDGSLSILEDGAGPPLCAVDDFAYTDASYRMRRGDRLCLVTDGVTEAQNAACELYGRARLTSLLRGSSGRHGDALRASSVVEDIRADVETFAAGAEASDDLTILVLRWCGPQEAAH